MIKLTRVGMSTVVEKLGEKPLMENVPEDEARTFMKKRNEDKAPGRTTIGRASSKAAATSSQSSKEGDN